jgi:hypothetical protein
MIGVILNGVLVMQYFDTERASVYIHYEQPSGAMRYIENKELFDYLRNEQPFNINILKELRVRLWRDDTDVLAFHHIMNIFLSIGMLIKVIKQEKDIAQNRQYKNRFLNKINAIIGKHCFLWAFILFIPVFLVITLILLLFGQEKDAMIKVWTETTTWTFSQYDHPPYLDSQGHYLCTVAACGHPRIVKPLRLGMRRNRPIIVNRQLMVANAYEKMIENYFPAFHKIIRSLYDRYGYPISRHITNAYMCDIIYVLMKPLECFFILNLYLFELKPERLINEQYKK